MRVRAGLYFALALCHCEASSSASVEDVFSIAEGASAVTMAGTKVRSQVRLRSRRVLSGGRMDCTFRIIGLSRRLGATTIAIK
jgi:hypothetical protein